MNAQNNAAEAFAAPIEAPASAAYTALSSDLNRALAAGDKAGKAERVTLWAIVDAFRGGDLSHGEAVKLHDVYMAARIKEASRSKVRQRFVAVLKLKADAEAEQRDTRTPANYGQALERKADAAKRKADAAAAAVKTVAKYDAEATRILAAKAGVEPSLDFRAENIAEVTALAATLAATGEARKALVAALEAAKAAGLASDYVAAEVSQVFA
ncbi:MAG: hypothetical protein LLG45_01385 [Actinomycetia bacterium]|nr:hypothetical protein [Actinomycetes bacterium]